jgi:hypothetical protein
LEQWRHDTAVTHQNDPRVLEGKDGKTVTFEGIQLPHRQDGRPVELTAYAFNEDRVRSEIARTQVPALSGTVTKRAFLLTIGVNDYGGAGWDLSYAAKDARVMAERLTPYLVQAGYHPEVKTLVSDDTAEQATRQSIQTAIEGIARQSTPG